MTCIYGECNGRNCLDCEEAKDRRDNAENESNQITPGQEG